MPLLREDLFVEAMMNRRFHVPAYFSPSVAAAQQQFNEMADRKSALLVLSTLRESIINGAQMHKMLRPWDLNPKIFDDLDKAQPWWGFEFETGWQSREAMKEALTHVWDNYEGCMFDGEGEGRYPVEITFIPAALSDYKNGTASACKFMQWVSDNRHLVYAGGANDVGCHWNVSTPEFRHSRANADGLCRFLNRTLANTRGVNGQRLRMFGRETIYAGFFVNHSADGQLLNPVENVWLEMKGFRTAYSIEQWNNYMNTCTALQKVINYYFANRGECQGKACDNLYDVAFNGADVKISALNVRPAAGAAPLYSRGIGVNAGCII